MTTKIVDAGVNTRSATYTGPGTMDANCVKSAGAHNLLTGNFTSDGSIVQINCGFNPRTVRVVNDTDGIIWERIAGMASTHAVKTVLGGSLAETDDTNGRITIGTDHTVTLDATLCGTSKVIAFAIEG